MTLDLSQHALSPALLNDGAWFAIEPWLVRGELRLARTDDEPAVRLRSWDSDKFQLVLLETMQQANPLGIKMEPEAFRKAGNAAMARGLITGLREVALTTGGPLIVFSAEAVQKVLDDARYPQLRELCSIGSRSMAHYREVAEERRLGN